MDSDETHTVNDKNGKTGISEFVVDDVNQSESTQSSCTNKNSAVMNNGEASHYTQTDVQKDLEKENEKETSVLSNSNPSSVSGSVVHELEKPADSSVNGGVLISSDSPNFSANNIGQSRNNEKSEVVIKTSKPLCADYYSDSDSESVDSESDSSSTSTWSSGTSSDSEEETDGSSSTGKTKAAKGEKKSKVDISLSDLPPIENLTISVPEDACVEVGTITSIVETLVIVESYKGTAALDVDTVLFLDSGRQTLGKVFDILGPVSEPVYAVRFNTQEQITSLNIKKDMKVYYAPKTEHTNFVFMSEVLKNKGSDASWKDNAEAPPEFQDFSDDEAERLHRNKGKEYNRDNPNSKEENKSRKRPFNKLKQTPRILQGSRFRNPEFSQQRAYFPRNPSANQFMGQPAYPRPNFPVQIPPFPYNPPPYPAASSHSRLPPVVYPHRLSGPPFPTFGGLAFPNQNFQQPFFQQRTHAFPQALGAWGKPMFRPPPPPPPPADQGDR